MSTKVDYLRKKLRPDTCNVPPPFSVSRFGFGFRVYFFIPLFVKLFLKKKLKKMQKS